METYVTTWAGVWDPQTRPELFQRKWKTESWRKWSKRRNRKDTVLMDEVVIESEVKREWTDGVVSKSVPPSTRVSSDRRGSLTPTLRHLCESQTHFIHSFIHSRRLPASYYKMHPLKHYIRNLESLLPGRLKSAEVFCFSSPFLRLCLSPRTHRKK